MVGPSTVDVPVLPLRGRRGRRFVDVVNAVLRLMDEILHHLESFAPTVGPLFGRTPVEPPKQTAGAGGHNETGAAPNNACIA